MFFLMSLGRYISLSADLYRCVLWLCRHMLSFVWKEVDNVRYFDSVLTLAFSLDEGESRFLEAVSNRTHMKMYLCSKDDAYENAVVNNSCSQGHVLCHKIKNYLEESFFYSLAHHKFPIKSICFTHVVNECVSGHLFKKKNNTESLAINIVLLLPIPLNYFCIYFSFFAHKNSHILSLKTNFLYKVRVRVQYLTKTLIICFLFWPCSCPDPTWGNSPVTWTHNMLLHLLFLLMPLRLSQKKPWWHHPIPRVMQIQAMKGGGLTEMKPFIWSTVFFEWHTWTTIFLLQLLFIFICVMHHSVELRAEFCGWAFLYLYRGN